jgi:hypothetical protein
MIFAILLSMLSHQTTELSGAALACAPVSLCGSPAARSRGLQPVTPRRRPACGRQGARPTARRGVGEASGGLPNPEGACPTGLWHKQ